MGFTAWRPPDEPKKAVDWRGIGIALERLPAAILWIGCGRKTLQLKTKPD
jgi:hypothetical protein